MSFYGRYSPYSVYHTCSPLPKTTAIQAIALYQQYPGSGCAKAVVEPLLSRLSAALHTAGPICLDPTRLTSWSLHRLFALTELRTSARKCMPSLTHNMQPPTHTPSVAGRHVSLLEQPPRSGARRRCRPSVRPAPQDAASLLDEYVSATPEPPPLFEPLDAVRLFNPAPAGPEATVGAPCTHTHEPLPLKKPSQCFKVPDMLILIKPKIKELEDACVFKQREVIRHGSHPFRRYGRLMSRGLSLISKSACSHPSVWEFISMRELRTVVGRWSAQYAGDCTTLAELDLVEIFPNVDRQSIPPALIFFFEHYCNTHNMRSQATRFFIHKGGVKGLDCIAHDCRRPGFFKFSFQDVMHFVLWDLMFNDTFVMCSSVFVQSLGTAIGGSASA